MRRPARPLLTNTVCAIRASCVHVPCPRRACLRMCVLPARLLGRDRFKTLQDAYCGVCILALYFLYLMVVKGALSVFDCSPVRCRCLPVGSAR
jgi:hypothetical protein